MLTEAAPSKSTSLLDIRLKNSKPVTALISLYSFESLGIRYVASSLRHAGYDCVEIFYEDLKRNSFEYPKKEALKKLTALLKRKNVDIVGLSVRSSYRKLAAMITREVHEELGIPVIWGSTHATICPEDSLNDADAVCRGEGEKVMVMLMDAIASGGDITKIPSIWLKTPDGEIVRNDIFPYVNLDEIPDPQFDAANKFYSRDGVWHDGDPQRHEGAFTIISSRGCPHICSFCSNSFFMKANSKFLRIRGVDKVIEEIKRARRIMPGIKRVKFYDDLFATNKKWTDEFVEKYKKEVGLPFDALLNPQHVSESLVEKLKDAGMTLVEMGIQNGSERMANEIYDRKLSNEKLLHAVDILNGSGLRVHYDLIIDNPLETSEDKKANFEFMLRVPRPYSLFILSLIHFPGTPLTQRLLKMGLIKDEDIEGNTDRSLFQWEVSLNHERPAEDKFWLALLSLLTKDFVPKGFIRFLAGRKLLMRHPAPLIAVAWIANVMKMAQLAWVMYREGSLTLQVIRRHANLKSLAIK